MVGKGLCGFGQLHQGQGQDWQDGIGIGMILNIVCAILVIIVLVFLMGSSGGSIPTSQVTATNLTSTSSAHDKSSIDNSNSTLERVKSSKEMIATSVADTDAVPMTTSSSTSTSVSTSSRKSSRTSSNSSGDSGSSRTLRVSGAASTSSRTSSTSASSSTSTTSASTSSRKSSRTSSNSSGSGR